MADLKKNNKTKKIMVQVPIERNYIANLDLRAIFGNEIMQFFLKNLVYLDNLEFINTPQDIMNIQKTNTHVYINVQGNRDVILFS